MAVQAHNHHIPLINITVSILFLALPVQVLLTISSIIFLFLKFCTMTVRRNQPARNPREGVLQNLKKERKKERKELAHAHVSLFK